MRTHQAFMRIASERVGASEQLYVYTSVRMDSQTDGRHCIS